MRLVLTNTPPKNFKTSCTAASSVVLLISMGTICYAYECKYSEHNMQNYAFFILSVAF